MYSLYKTCDFCGEVISKNTSPCLGEATQDVECYPVYIHICINDDTIIPWANDEDRHIGLCAKCAKDFIYNMRTIKSKGRFYHGNKK